MNCTGGDFTGGQHRGTAGAVSEATAGVRREAAGGTTETQGGD